MEKAARNLAAFFVCIQNQSMQAVIFDMDGVISDTEPLQAQAEADVMRSVGLSISVQTMIDRFSGIPETDVWKILCGENGIPLPSIDALREQKFAILSSIARGNVQGIPGTIALIQALKAQGVPRAIASSSRLEFISIVIEELNIHDDFNAIISGTDVCHGKPAPDIFLLAAQRMGIEPCDCIVIEDANAGVIAAKAAGMKAIGYQPSHSHQDLSSADLVISDMHTLTIDVLRKL